MTGTDSFNYRDAMQWTAVGILLFLAAMLLKSCATPVSPQGGEGDEEGPKVVSSEPETGTTNFEGRSIRIQFDEFVERQNFESALEVEPDLDIGYDIKWRRKAVIIEFEEELPELTTVIVSIGTDLTDTHNNKVSDPVKIAVSTGPEIDSGELVGRIVDARTGEVQEGERVFLYRDSLDLDSRANYVAETDTGGVVEFSYLAEGTYYAFWVDDRNRNKIWDPDQERAQPFGEEYVELEKAGEDTLGSLFVAQSDTTAPELQGVGLYNSQRFRLRFSENIEITDSTEIVVNDSLGRHYSDVTPLYIDPSDGYILFAHSGEELAEEDSYNLLARGVEDGAGNMADTLSSEFDGSAQEDTTLQRIIQQKYADGIFPDEPITLVYAAPITEDAVTDSLRIIAEDSSITYWEYLEVENNLLRILPDEEWERGTDYTLEAWNPIQEGRRSMPVNVWHENALGGLYFFNADTTDTLEYRMVLENEPRGVVLDTTFSEEIELEEIAPVPHKVTVFGDLNGNGEWDPGRIDSYEAPEPFFIRRDLPVEDGFTSETAIELEP